ncbi:uncharacterized protein TA05610 [Theileria annulata]|uniref:Inositol hexakisphosphate and diphosphoinositol-pentakisphosphate kinase n=1 Tax=Theileria annulata TaxID=5874 RepID=Q4UHM7_THEAN|nr:uncharacterized protein TA05610 [Theileria annulata]CAI73412.1 hypothetical protein, conserved [Theileria annulata]|eukprot:XP_954089.1 hypothetical protein, conserved [Theileria annulata]
MVISGVGSVKVKVNTNTTNSTKDSTNSTKDISSTAGTIGASTVTEGKGANSMGMECTTNNTKEAPFGAGTKDITGREPGTVTEDTVMELNEILKNDTSAASIAATSLLISNTYLNSKDIFDNGKCFIGGLKPSEMYLFNNKSQTELLYNSSVTVLGQTDTIPPNSTTNPLTNSSSTDPSTVGASTVTEEKNSNEIAVVTKSGESGTFLDTVGIEGAPIRAVGEVVNTKDSENICTVGASTVTDTVTEEKIINSYNLWSHENIEDKLTNNKGYHDLGYKYNKTMESKDIESELLNITNVLPYDGNPKIRSRYYVTSASHLFSVFNFFKYAHLLDDSFDTNSKQIENINDLHYLSHIVLRVWRSKSDKGYFNRLEILVSSGAKDGFGQNYQLLEKNAKNQKNNYKKYIQKLQLHKFSKFCNQCYIPSNLNNTNGTTSTGTVTDTTGTMGTTGVNVMNINVLDKYNLMYENIKEKKFKCYNCFLKEYKTLYNLQNFTTDNFTTADLGFGSPNIRPNSVDIGLNTTDIGLNTPDIGLNTPNNNLDKFNTDNNLDKFNTDNFSTLDIGFKPDIGLSTQDIGLNRGMNNGVKMVPPYCELNTLVTMNRNFGLDRLKDYIQKAYHNILLKN